MTLVTSGSVSSHHGTETAIQDDRQSRDERSHDKKGTTGDWFVSFALETDDADLPEKPVVDSLDASNTVGVNLGINNYSHTSDGKTEDLFDLEDESERLRREQRRLSRKQEGSNNDEKQRKEVASVNGHIRREVLDYQHKIPALRRVSWKSATPLRPLKPPSHRSSGF